MKVVESGYDPSAQVKPAATRLGRGAILTFLGITALTVIVAFSLSELKYGVLNLGFLAGGLVLLMLLALAFPQMKANWRYLRARLNRWHLIWYGIYISALVWEVRTLESYRGSPLDAFSALRLGPELFIGLYMLYLMGTGRVKWFSSLFRGIPGVLAFYCVYCASTALWSVFWPWTVFKSGEYLLDVSVIAAILCVVSTTEEYRTLLDWTWTIFAVELVWCVIQIPIFPGQALEDGRLCGVFPLTAFNAVGTYAAVISIVAICRLMPVTKGVFDRSWYVSLFLFGTVLVVMSQTRNALGGLLGAVVVILLVNKRGIGALLIGSAAAAILYTALGEVLKTFLKRGQSEDAFNTMSGRLIWWQLAWKFFKLRPWGGVGAYAGGKFAVLQQLHTNAGSTHSDYIELLVGTGIIGTVLFATAVLWTLFTLFLQWRNTSYTPNERQTSMECFSVLLVLFIHSFFNVELTWHAPMFFLVCVGWAEFLRRKKKKADEIAVRQLLTPQFRTSEIIFSQS
ncbi:MAG: O-antigen ligase family protein [Terriglobales bacterium]